MIVIGVDVHKQSVTAVAVDEAGRMLCEVTVRVGSEELAGWAADLSEERLWALEDCRRLTRWLERQLLAAGEELVRVPPKLMAPERRSGRGRGKSDPIDALAVARAALREPGLARPRVDATRSSTSVAVSISACVGTCTSSTRASRCRCGCSRASRTWNGSAAGLPVRTRSCRCGSRVSWSLIAARSTA